MTFINRPSKKLKKGVLYVRVNGKRKSTGLEDTSNNRKLIKEYYENDEFFNKFDINKNVPFLTDLCLEVLKEKESIIKATSYISYESLYRNKIETFFKDMYVNQLKPKHIELWYKTFNDKSSLNTCNSIIKKAIEKAILREYIVNTPLIVSKPNFKSYYEINPFTIEEINKLLYNSIGWFRNFIAISFFTGLRTGEVLGLKWSDIDFNNYIISVNRTITTGYIQTPKTKSSIRDIDILPQCEEYLFKQRLLTGLSEFIFISGKNTPFKSSSCLNSKWKSLLSKCNLDYRGIYQLRHSFASNMLSNGESLFWVSSMLGHKSSDITLSKYTKYLKKNRERKKTFFDNINSKLAH